MADKSIGELAESAGPVRFWILLAFVAVLSVVLYMGDILKPGAFGRMEKKRDVAAFPSLIWLLAGISLFLGLSMAVDFAANQPLLVGDRGGIRALAASQAAGYAIAGLLAWCLVYLMVRSAPNSGLKIEPADLLLGLLCFVIAYPFIAFAATATESMVAGLGGEKPAEIAHGTLQMIVDAGGSPWRWALIAAVVLGAPIVEEIVFRGFLQSGLLRSTQNPVWSILITSGVFAWLHVDPSAFQTNAAVASTEASGAPVHAIIPLFVLSVAIGIAYERTKRLGVAITMHAVFNALNVAMALGWFNLG